MENKDISLSRGTFNATIDTNEVISCKATGCNKLDTTDWLSDIPESNKFPDVVEVRFKNTRKGYFKNINKIRLTPGDLVAVEASPGHDIGIVSLTGELVLRQMYRTNFRLPENEEMKKVYRKAKSVDVEKWIQAIEQEKNTMLRSRQIASKLELNMKIGDVEYQGDKTKAIFYYIADDRVDFRELIKLLAEEFKVRIEMKQIGARQEAGRIGGIGSCGRELCCSTWLSNFVSVTTNAARFQEVSLNPTKLAGQCGKLKCCINYELKCYADARLDFPNTEIPLEIFDGTAFHSKTDVYRRLMWYSFSKDDSINLIPVPVERVSEIMELNKKGVKVKKLIETEEERQKDLSYHNPVGQESVTRFQDNKPPQTHRHKKRHKPRQPGQNPQGPQGQQDPQST
jgi:cell fate regulator YaaT (PSP1 superfamily)